MKEHKYKYCMVSLLCGTKNVKLMEIEEQVLGGGGEKWGEGQREPSVSYEMNQFWSSNVLT